MTGNTPGQGLDVVAPPSAAVAPPGYYMLFLLNDDGVPSVARWIKLEPGSNQPTEPAGSSGANASVDVSRASGRRALRRRGRVSFQVGVDQATTVDLSVRLSSASWTRHPDDEHVRGRVRRGRLPDGAGAVPEAERSPPGLARQAPRRVLVRLRSSLRGRRTEKGPVRGPCVPKGRAARKSIPGPSVLQVLWLSIGTWMRRDLSLSRDTNTRFRIRLQLIALCGGNLASLESEQALAYPGRPARIGCARVRYLITGGLGLHRRQADRRALGPRRDRADRDRRRQRRPSASGRRPSSSRATSATGSAIQGPARAATRSTAWSTSPSSSTRSATRR